MGESPADSKPLIAAIEEELNKIKARRNQIDEEYEKQNPWNHSVTWFRERRSKGVFLPTLFQEDPEKAGLGGGFPRKARKKEDPWSKAGRFRMERVAERHSWEDIEGMDLWVEELKRQRDQMLDQLENREAELREQLAALREPKGP